MPPFDCTLKESEEIKEDDGNLGLEHPASTDDEDYADDDNFEPFEEESDSMSVISERSSEVNSSEEVFKKFMEFNELLTKWVQYLGKTVDGQMSQAELTLQNRNEMISVCSLLERIVNNFGELGSLLGTCVGHLKATIELCSRERIQIYQNVCVIDDSPSPTETTETIADTNAETKNESHTTSSLQNLADVSAQLSLSAASNYNHYYFAQSFTHQLRNLTSDQVDIAQKLISEILTQGRMGNLTSGSKISNTGSESNTLKM